ncbi:FAD binding domain-containing protein [Nocardioides campestrisoli]|uniref:FAD binding domain-containing protein n=1 Tax=Nocardioides campestrisoli TaxID=2736757 RepID=UPI00163DCDA7|nr:FAD binding domain-containing protein [Nocardioides campestrisoli]
MDLGTVTSYREATGRHDLRLGPGERPLGGGTWLFSQPQPGTTGLVDLTTLGWPAYERLGDGSLRIAATCTVAELLALPWDEQAPGPGALARTCADALLMSFKIQAAATVGGNLCLALPAGAMLALTAALGGQVLVWTPEGGERREPVTEFVTGVGATTLAPGEVLRAIDLPASVLQARTAGRRMALTPRGRSSALVLGRAGAHATTLTVTAATTRPVVLEVPHGAGHRALEEALAVVDCWYEDAHGAADWRRAVTGLLAAEVLDELTEPAPAGQRPSTGREETP